MRDTLRQERLLPKAKPRMIDLVQSAGFDVEGWSNYKGGPKRAAANPKYCYEWCYEQEDMFLLNIWYENMSFEVDAIRQYLNLRTRPTDFTGPRKKRASRFDEAVGRAFQIGSHPRAIIQHRSQPKTGGVETRLLDPSPWTVERYDAANGDMVLRRGIFKADGPNENDLELASFEEGQKRRAFLWHRNRENQLRQAKIAAALASGGNRLQCEVEGCRFDFREVYGELGKEFAHVHHLRPLSEFENSGETVTIDNLAVVCANCHAMIHRDGECRPLKGLIATRGQNV